MAETLIKQYETVTYEYLTVEECIRRNGHRHLERAIAYASAGYPDRYFEGSMKKALKAYAKAELFKTPDWMIKAYGHRLKEISDHVSDAILYGRSFTKTDENGWINHIPLKAINEPDAS